MVISGYEHVPVYENTSHRFVGGEEEKDVSDQICIAGCQIFWCLNISELDYKKYKKKKLTVIFWDQLFCGEKKEKEVLDQLWITEFQIFWCLDIEYIN